MRSGSQNNFASASFTQEYPTQQDPELHSKAKKIGIEREKKINALECVGDENLENISAILVCKFSLTIALSELTFGDNTRLIRFNLSIML